LAAACEVCGFANEAEERFCGGCGRPLLSDESLPSTRPPDTYTPSHLAEKILIARAALEGERKHVTVLFADLKGSMELLADRDPEEARRILDPVLERMMEAVHRYEGTVNQVMGDGIMALFGAPSPTRTTRSAPAMPLCGCKSPSSGTRSKRADAPARPFPSAWALIQARSSCAQLGAICVWITAQWDKRRIWPRAWSRRRSLAPS
jgi:class 3 adenylate cyclase